jgi:hypothetical protein
MDARLNYFAGPNSGKALKYFMSVGKALKQAPLSGRPRCGRRLGPGPPPCTGPPPACHAKPPAAPAPPADQRGEDREAAHDDAVGPLRVVPHRHRHRQHQPSSSVAGSVLSGSHRTEDLRCLAGL